MDLKYLKRSTPIDTDGITIINGMGREDSKPKLDRSSNRSEGEYSKSPDSLDNTDIYVTDWARDEDSSESDLLSPKSTSDRKSCERQGSIERLENERKAKLEELYKKHDEIWQEFINEKRRIISQGDLKYDLGQRVMCLLPFYVDRKSSRDEMTAIKIKSLSVISGTITDIDCIEVSKNDDIPRETKLRSSPDSSSIDFNRPDQKESKETAAVRPSRRNIYSRDKEWAKNIIVNDWKFGDTSKWKSDTSVDNEIQTMMVSYKIKLDKEFRLTQEEVDKIQIEVKLRSKLPFSYDLNFSKSEPDKPQERTPVPITLDPKIIRKKKKKKGEKKIVESAVTKKTEIIYDTITVDYRYVMGDVSKCKKVMADIKRVDRITVTTLDMENYIKRLKLYPGVFIQYADDDGSGRLSGLVNFVVIDHFCVSPTDVRFVIRCNSEPKRILAVSRINSFDIRGKYDVSKYKCFHPLERYSYTIIDPNLTAFDDSIKDIIKGLFDQIKVFIVQKSLCSYGDMESFVYEDGNGCVHVIPKGSNIKLGDNNYRLVDDKTPQYITSALSIAADIPQQPREIQTKETQTEQPKKQITILKRETQQDSGGFISIGKSQEQKQDQKSKTEERIKQDQKSPDQRSLKYKYTGISLTSYVKGLAYLDGNKPTQHHEYTFFHSKDYFELDLDPMNPTFLNYICTTEKHKLFRNPIPGDVILAVPFICDRGQFKGKINLKWFYPTDEFRLLHLYIATNGSHPHFVHNFAVQSRQKMGLFTENDKLLKIRSLFKGNNLCLFDLYIYGLSRNNPTINSDFTKRFCTTYFWWERLSSELSSNP